MFNPFSFLKPRGASSSLGLDIGTASIKIVEAARGDGAPRIVNYAILESRNTLTRANTAFQTSTLKLFDDEVVELLEVALKKMRPRTQNVIVSLPDFAAFITTIMMPDMAPAELEKSMQFQVKQYIPFPLEEVAIDWQRVGTYTDDQGVRHNQILIVSVPQEQIRKYQSICKRTGLTLQALEVEGFSLVRSLVGSDPTPTCIVDIGSRSTVIAIADGGQLVYASQSDYAGASLTQALASSLNINPLRAEELKRERGIIGTGPNIELSMVMLPFLDVILGEVKRAQFSFTSQPGGSNRKIERIILSGGGANLLGIEKYVSRELGAPAVKAAGCSRFSYPVALEPFVRDLNPLMSVALGLALRAVA